MGTIRSSLSTAARGVSAAVLMFPAFSVSPWGRSDASASEIRLSELPSEVRDSLADTRRSCTGRTAREAGTGPSRSRSAGITTTRFADGRLAVLVDYSAQCTRRVIGLTSCSTGGCDFTALVRQRDGRWATRVDDMASSVRLVPGDNPMLEITIRWQNDPCRTVSRDGRDPRGCVYSVPLNADGAAWRLIRRI